MEQEDSPHLQTTPPVPQEPPAAEAPQPPPKPTSGGGGWGGWGLPSLSVFQKAAEEISRNAVEVAKGAAKGIAEMQTAVTADVAGDGDRSAFSSDDNAEEGEKKKEDGKEGEGESDQMRKAALDKLENASQESFLGQGLKSIDSTVESLTSGTWLALDSVWKGGSNLVQKLESSASSLAETIQHGNLPVNASTIAPSFLETGKSFTAKGMEVLERVGKETMELIIEETGLEVEKDNTVEEDDEQIEEEQFEEVSFDRCFYIYGGPDQLEELEALSSHYALLFNRKKGKLGSEQKSLYDGKLKEIQQIFNLGDEIEESGADSDKGKNIEPADTDGDSEMKKLCDSSVSKAANMAAGFASALGGLAPNEIIQRTADRLETIHSEGVHRLSELCCIAVSRVLMLGKSVISAANKSKGEEVDEDDVKIDWPEDSVSKAKIIRWKAQCMYGDVEKVSNSFATGISDVAESYLAAIQNAVTGNQETLPEQNALQEKVKSISENLNADQTIALSKIQDAVQYLAYVVLCTSMPSV